MEHDSETLSQTEKDFAALGGKMGNRTALMRFAKVSGEAVRVHETILDELGKIYDSIRDFRDFQVPTALSNVSLFYDLARDRLTKEAQGNLTVSNSSAGVLLDEIT